MVTRVDKSILHPACILNHDAPILEALKKMEACHATCLIIQNPEGYGIVTDADFRDYILHQKERSLELLSDVQSYPALSIQEGELLFNILLLMMEHTIKHLPVFDGNRKILGVMELIDLLSFFSNQSYLISVQMEKALNAEDIIRAASRLEIMISSLHSKGIKSRYIAKLVSELNRKMYAKLYEMIIPSSWHSKCTLILLGSEGRGEQILRTDQDNALIFEDGFVPDNLDQITEKFIGVLDKIGFPRCSGNVMMINPKWQKSLSGYLQEIDTWIDQPSYDGLMNMAILFDSIPVAGAKELHSKVVEYLMQQVKEHQNILTYFVKPIESFESPLGFFSQFITSGKEHQNEIDIKKGALFALIHGVRALALEHGITVTNTILRIKELNNMGFFSKEDTKELIEALEVINTLRLHSQLEQLAKGEQADNYIAITSLGKLERDILKEAIKCISAFKKLIHYHFHLSMVS